jgi:hypothetical protein
MSDPRETPSSLFGLKVHVSRYAVTWAPNRVHKQRRNQTKAYHARVQKKWNKRFGKREVPCVYLIGGGFGFGQDQSLVINPAYSVQLKGFA